MATIKTTGIGSNLRIITKTVSGQQRVSCSCCEEAGCCMYPSIGFGEFYSYEDLPDEIVLFFPIGDSLLLQKTAGPFGGTYTSEEVDEEGVSVIYEVGGDFDGPSFSALSGPFASWNLGASSNGVPRFFVNSLGECLVQDTTSGTRTRDTFEDTYTVDLNYSNIGNIEGSVNETVTVTRQSICVWSGLDSRGNTVTIEYISFDGSVEGSPARLARWTVTFYTYQGDSSEEWLLDKTGVKSSPVGVYGDPPAGVGSAGGATVT